jgi:hypothetical protein
MTCRRRWRRRHEGLVQLRGIWWREGHAEVIGDDRVLSLSFVGNNSADGFSQLFFCNIESMNPFFQIVCLSTFSKLQC